MLVRFARRVRCRLLTARWLLPSVWKRFSRRVLRPARNFGFRPGVSPRGGILLGNALPGAVDDSLGCARQT